MTREEYIQEIKACHSSSQHVDVCEEYITSLEQHIAELSGQLIGMDKLLSDTSLKLSDANTYFDGIHAKAPNRCIDCKDSTQLNRAFCMCEHFGKVKVNHYCSYYEPKDKE